MPLARDVSITWLGGTTVLVRSPTGRSLLLDPAAEHPAPEAVDALLVCHAGALEETVRLARARSLPVVAVAPIARWLEKQGVASVLSMNVGGSCDVLGVRVTMIHAEHATAAPDSLPTTTCGWLVTFGNGFRIYHSGPTGLFGDMALVGEVYRPDLVLLAVGEADLMSPLEAAHAVRLLRAKRVVPMAARAALGRALRAHLDELGLEKVSVVDLAPGQALS